MFNGKLKRKILALEHTNKTLLATLAQKDNEITELTKKLTVKTTKTTTTKTTKK